MDSEHGGIEHGNFVWAVTAKWNNTSGGIPVLSNAIFVEKIPEYTRLVGNYPNPFNPDTNIQFWLKEDNFVSLKIYNSRGQKVRTLLSADMKAGNHTIAFDGKDDAGRILSSGLYFSHLKTGKYHRTLKMILSK
ncbi:MAG TPA: FlgD immunoglobulin-like domain containing protein [Candidatus Cloacimonadota bacterium]|nr:FlgD immunoglobulin-like domain containing protein [Candidatus Cloacimonadota bacterium]